MIMGDGIGSRAIKGGGEKKLVQITLHPHVQKKKTFSHPPPQKCPEAPQQSRCQMRRIVRYMHSIYTFLLYFYIFY